MFKYDFEVDFTAEDKGGKSIEGVEIVKAFNSIHAMKLCLQILWSRGFNNYRIGAVALYRK